jgi:hypothetical protein
VCKCRSSACNWRYLTSLRRFQERERRIMSHRGVDGAVEGVAPHGPWFERRDAAVIRRRGRLPCENPQVGTRRENLEIRNSGIEERKRNGSCGRSWIRDFLSSRCNGVAWEFSWAQIPTRRPR